MSTPIVALCPGCLHATELVVLDGDYCLGDEVPADGPDFDRLRALLRCGAQAEAPACEQCGRSLWGSKLLPASELSLGL